MGLSEVRILQNFRGEFFFCAACPAVTNNMCALLLRNSLSTSYRTRLSKCLTMNRSSPWNVVLYLDNRLWTKYRHVVILSYFNLGLSIDTLSHNGEKRHLALSYLSARNNSAPTEQVYLNFVLGNSSTASVV